MSKALFLVKNGKAASAFELRDQVLPALQPGQLRIAVEASGINFADVMARQGLYREAPPLPFVPGYEVVGEVIEAGAAADAAWVGKRVTAFTRFGGYAEEVITQVRAVAEIDPGLSAVKAAALATQYVTAYYAAIELAGIRSGENVLVHAAAGGVGTALVQLARLKGCTVFATTGGPEKAEFVRRNGADHVILYRQGDYEEQIKKRLGNARLQVSFNAVAGSTFKKDMRLLGSGGKLVMYGAAERAGKKGGLLATLRMVMRMGLLMPVGLMMNSRSLLGINMLKLADDRPELLERCLRAVNALYREGKIDPLPGGEFPVSSVAEAHELLESRKSVGKIILRWKG